MRSGRFPPDPLEAFRAARILGVRAGAAHRYTGVRVVVGARGGSSIGPLIAIGCSLVGCASGAAAGARHSVLAAVLGGALGLGLGQGLFWGSMIPYVGWQVRRETRHPSRPPSAPSRLWQWLLLPLMTAALLLSALVPGYLVRLVAE